MYSETNLFLPYMHSFAAQDFQQLGDYCKTQKPNASMDNPFPALTISEYSLGGDGDLFKAPEPIIEEPALGLDPMAAAMLLFSCGEDIITSQELKAADIESFQNEQLLEVLFECEKDMMAQAAIGTSLVEVLDIENPVEMDESRNQENEMFCDVQFLKSVSSSCLSSMEWMQGAAAMKPNFLEFPGMDFDAVYGMRRAFSEGDIKAFGNGNASGVRCSVERPVIFSCSTEDRREKLSRYWNKKTKRNFGRKIKYACRKALADSQPRIRGRFVRTEEPENSKRQ